MGASILHSTGLAALQRETLKKMEFWENHLPEARHCGDKSFQWAFFCCLKRTEFLSTVDIDRRGTCPLSVSFFFVFFFSAFDAL